MYKPVNSALLAGYITAYSVGLFALGGLLWPREKEKQVVAEKPAANYTTLEYGVRVHEIQDTESGRRFFVVATNAGGVAIHLIPEPDSDDQLNMMTSLKKKGGQE